MAKTGNKDADAKPTLVIATPFMIFVTKLIGILTSSSITSVIPQYPVCGLFFPLPKFGVILIFAANFEPSFLIKLVLVICSPV